jgi:UDP-N-acetyl-D-galactosamine dehydrogenase
MIAFEDLASRKESIAVVGLGYVGLPLAVSLSGHFNVVGFDISDERIADLGKGIDRTREVAAEDLVGAEIKFTSDPGELGRCKMIVIAVPTPIDKHRRPDLGPIAGATATVGERLMPGSVVVYESTVYPGLTEEVCVPILEERSGLVCGRDFTVGYSPERINPGDKEHTLTSIIKVVAGQDERTLDILAAMYEKIVEAGVHRTSSIKVAEAAKVIENTQRDLNIALINELAIIFDRLGIDTTEVLEAAGTKWNFLNFRPGLVGGHCIGVDPYYLTYKAEEVGHHPEVILAGRRINDGMGRYIVSKAVQMLIRSDLSVRNARVGILGMTFKEDCPDLRNTRVIDIVHELREFDMEVVVHDPMADPEEAGKHYEVCLRPFNELRDMNAVIVAVGHGEYRDMDLDEMFAGLIRGGCVLDVKSILDPAEVRKRGYGYWSL